MSTRANQQLGQISTLEQMGILGPMYIGASGLSGEIGTRKNEHQSKWALGNWGRLNEQFGQMGVWDKWACGNWDKWMFGEMGTLGQNPFGTNGHFRTDELWGKWAWGANAYLGKKSTRENEHQGK